MPNACRKHTGPTPKSCWTYCIIKHSICRDPCATHANIMHFRNHAHDSQAHVQLPRLCHDGDIQNTFRFLLNPCQSNSNPALKPLRMHACRIQAEPTFCECRVLLECMLILCWLDAEPMLSRHSNLAGPILDTRSLLAAAMLTSWRNHSASMQNAW